MILKLALFQCIVIPFDHPESKELFFQQSSAVSLLTAEQETRSPDIKITVLFHILFLCLRNSNPLART
jgi:hypothetical protein